MDELEAIAALEKVEKSELTEGRDHAEIVSVMLMAFPHLFPPATNQWKPNVATRCRPGHLRRSRGLDQLL